MSQSRNAVPEKVKRAVLAEAGHMCANPRCRALILELHHIVWVKNGGGNEASNLLALCPNCHALHTRGDIPRSTIELWKLMLMRLSDALDRDSLDLLLFMYRFEQENKCRYDPDPFMVTGDGILRLARLINTGLVDSGPAAFRSSAWSRSRGSFRYGTRSIWNPKLTDLGNRLMEAWTNGDAGTVRELLLGTASPPAEA